MLKKRSYRGRRLRKRSSAVGRKRSSVSVAVKKYVKSIVHKEAENKCIQLNYTTSLYSVTGSTTLNAFPISPYASYMAITQGVGQAGRVGNKIRTRKLMFNYVLRPLSYDATINTLPQPMEIQMIFGRTRNSPALLPAAADVQQMFQGSNGVIQPTGTLEDLCLPFNDDYWDIVKVVRHKLGYAESAGTGGSATSQYFSNNDFKMNVIRKLNLTKYIPKLLKYNDATNSPTSKGLFLFINVIPAGGSSPFGPTQLPCRIHSYINFEYEDS